MNAPPIISASFPSSYERNIPVVDEDVEYAQEGDEEASAPLGLESNSDHDTSSQSDDGNDNSGKRP